MQSTIYLPVLAPRPSFEEHILAVPHFGSILTFKPIRYGSAIADISKFKCDPTVLAHCLQLDQATLEIEVQPNWNSQHEAFVWLRAFLLLLSLRSNQTLAAPLALSKSLNAIPQSEFDSVEVHLVSKADAGAFRFGGEKLTSDHIEWAARNLVGFQHIGNEDRWMLAYRVLLMERTVSYPSVSLLTVWSGLETFFSIDREQTFRLSLMAAYFLESSPQAREDLFKQVRKAYGVRSKVTHGRNASDEETSENSTWALSLLRRCLVRSIEIRSLPTTESLFFS